MWLNYLYLSGLFNWPWITVWLPQGYNLTLKYAGKISLYLTIKTPTNQSKALTKHSHDYWDALYWVKTNMMMKIFNP